MLFVGIGHAVCDTWTQHTA